MSLYTICITVDIIYYAMFHTIRASDQAMRTPPFSRAGRG
jgi:hypothetical protein